ncbi:DUF6612 family protein [Bacillus sp. AFS041924]|uniref:DUF6612 family protein n=1 Tax=Bacillus sp. AFS041924 TaxID=2033503 RepID=UPI000BFD50CE|nr:DUF6612 family protein [Bacillus sp. AFS041924]PGS49377.1 hypothetical protein COC46_15180 [Bacillus sp. AFS041924]
MKKWLVCFTLVWFIIVLGACNKELTKKEVIAKVEDHAHEVEDYHAVIKLGVEIVDNSSDKTLQSSKAILTTDLNEKNLEGYGLVESNSNGISTNSEYYFTKENTFINQNNQGWQVVPNQDQIIQDNTFYKNVFHIIPKIADKLVMTKQADSYVFTFKGKDLDVYRAFEDPYSVKFVGVEPEDVQQDITIVINSKTFYIEKLTNTLKGQKDNISITININHVYKKMNDIEKLKIPKKVIDEANF